MAIRHSKRPDIIFVLTFLARHLDDALLNSVEGCTIGVVNSKKFCLIKCFSADFTPKATDLPSIFCLASIWSCKAASKSEAPKSTLLYQSCSNKKILADLMCVFDLWIWFADTSFKSLSYKSARIFLFDQLLYSKVDFGASDFEAALQLQTEAKQKMLGWSVAFGVKSVEKYSIRQNIFELTTSNAQNPPAPRIRNRYYYTVL